MHCSGVDEKVFKGNDRKKLFELIQTLDGDNEDFANINDICKIIRIGGARIDNELWYMTITIILRY